MIRTLEHPTNALNHKRPQIIVLILYPSYGTHSQICYCYRVVNSPALDHDYGWADSSLTFDIETLKNKNAKKCLSCNLSSPH